MRGAGGLLGLFEIGLRKGDELPLLLNDAPSPLPTLDSTRLLGHAAVDVALGEAHLPNWRGRPHVERFR